ncbi:MAG: Fe-Mn family superoxide dismutase [Defluviitaleaceae bacterium]|nr:Fe-Mn family superoxide dismutase [Defluviitaleaceae bacterium]MCL2238656.1 Fe-Mn family superoxide dismutase [Defluviitaleaceae bacterium]
MEITAKTFPYNTGVVTRKQFDDHLTLYNGYVKKTNEIAHTLAVNPERESANATQSHYRGLKRGQTYALDGVILHELYFENLGEKTTPMGKKTQKLLEMYFGGVDKWREDFIACALSARGWCVLSYEQRTQACHNFLFDSHDNGPIILAYPLIALDMYEHAYFLDYGTDKAAYINRFISQIPWDTVEKRVGAVMQ